MYSDWVSGPKEEQETVYEEAKGAIKASDFLPTAPARPDGTAIRVRIQSDMSTLISAPSLIIEREMDRLSEKQEQGRLDAEDIKVFRQLVDSLVALSREKRALDAKQQMDALTDVELEEMIRSYASEQKDT